MPKPLASHLDSQSLIELVSSRYSTKSFDPTFQISEAQLEAMKALLQFSPSSVNSQPWHFLLGVSSESRSRIAKSTEGSYSYNAAKMKNAAAVVVFCCQKELSSDYLDELVAHEVKDGRLANEEQIKKQKETRAMYVDLHKSTLKDTEHWLAKQVYLNLGSFLLGVAALGLDAVPMEGIDVAIMDEEFQLAQKGLTSLVAVAIGKRAEDDFNAKLPKSRWDQSSIITELA